MALITPEKFSQLTGIVIDNFEGGYYHPRMKLQMKPSDAAKMGDSGETMFGLDRKHGSQLAVYDGWNEFWELIDKSAANWRHNYIPPEPLKTQLKDLTSKIMFGWFNKLAGKYLNADSLAAIANDDRLIIHYSYASWNGEGWMKRFAAPLNDAVKNAANGKEQIFKAAIEARTLSSNAVIRQQGVNMMNLFHKLHLT